jgi:hypothetical protein
MHQTHSANNKTTGSTEDKPVTTEITVNDESHIIDAMHHIVSDAGVVSLYLGARSEDIDIQVVNGLVLCRSERARDRLNMHAGTDTDTVEDTGTTPQSPVMTDGGEGQ